MDFFLCDQGFIQAILMPGRWHKKLNLLAESFFYFKLFICPPDIERPTFFHWLLNPYLGSVMNLLQNQFLFKNGYY